MKSPDKILFVAEAMGTEKGLFGFWIDKDHRDTIYLQYININTLLEWAEKRKGKASIGLSEYDMGHENGVCEVLNELIEYIQKL